jgi:hypothetical protein
VIYWLRTLTFKGIHFVDALELAAALRAKSALDAMLCGTRAADQRDKAQAFKEFAFTMLRAGTSQQAEALLLKSENEYVAKAAAHMLGDSVWSASEAAQLAAAYIGSVADGSLLDAALASGAMRIPQNLAHSVFASGFAANDAVEAGVKVVKRVPVALSTAEISKAAAIVAMSKDLAFAIGGQKLFETELRKAVTRACNAAFLAALTTTSTTELATTGDALNDLRAGLRASVPSTAFVVAVSTAYAADLATRTENRGAGVRGGTFVPGVELVVVDDLTGLRVVPVDHIAIEDFGLRVASAEHASLDMQDSPTSPAQFVNLWQTNSVGLICEREFRMAANSDIVSVGA